jgi:hypothetical protein
MRSTQGSKSGGRAKRAPYVDVYIPLNNALAGILRQMPDAPRRLQTLRSYTIELMRPVRAHVDEGLLDAEEGLLVFLASAMVMALRAYRAEIGRRGLADLVTAVFPEDSPEEDA